MLAAIRARLARRSFDYQWGSLPTGAWLSDDPRFGAQVERIISEEELAIEPEWFRGRRVLDAGCGNGRWTEGFVRLGCEVTAIDASANALAQVRGRFGDGVRTLQGDVLEADRLLAGERFDLVWSWGVLHHTADTGRGIRALERLVADDGAALRLPVRPRHAADARLELEAERRPGRAQRGAPARAEGDPAARVRAAPRARGVRSAEHAAQPPHHGRRGDGAAAGGRTPARRAYDRSHRGVPARRPRGLERRCPSAPARDRAVLVPADHRRRARLMAAARIAVVVPCYNDGATVGETVDSVREPEPVEIVVVDDGSTDPATIALLDRLAANDRIQLVRKVNGGVASALRAGFDAARSPYVFVLASDDVADAGALAELADALDRAPGFDFAYGHSHHFGDVDFVRRAAPWNPWILLHSNLWEATCLFRRDAVIAAGGFPDGSGYEDWDLFMALAERGSAGLLVDRLVFHYRIHGGGRINPGVKLRFREHYAHAAEQPPAPVRERARAAAALPAAPVVAPALPRPAGGRPAPAARARAPSARRQASPAAAGRLGRRRAPVAAQLAGPPPARGGRGGTTAARGARSGSPVRRRRSRRAGRSTRRQETNAQAYVMGTVIAISLSGLMPSS